MSNSFSRSDSTKTRATEDQVYVCPLSAVPSIVADCNASHLVTCLQNEIVVDTPPCIKPDFHLRLHVHDISEPLLGYAAPGEDHVRQIIKFAHIWGGRGPMVIHCWAGISRSTAAALITLYTLNPDVPEDVVARQMREASPTAYPNRLMIRLADDALGRRGRMLEAVNAMGRGVVAHEAIPFSLPADFSRHRRAS